MPFDSFCTHAKPYYDRSVIAGKYDYKKFSHLLQSRIEVFGDIPDIVSFIEDFGQYDIALYQHKKMKCDEIIAKIAIKGAIEVFSNIEKINENLMGMLAIKSEEIGIKKGQMLFCLRLALTGKASTPGGAIEMADILGVKESLRRLNLSLAMLN